MDASICQLIVKESPIPYMHIRLIIGEKNQLNDFTVLSINKSFENLSGVDSQFLLNQLGSLVLPHIFEDQARWNRLFNAVLKDLQTDEMDKRIYINDRCFYINILSVTRDEWVLKFEDFALNEEHYQDLEKMIQYSQDFLQYSGIEIDYQKIVDDFMQICSGKFAVFNLFAEDGRNFKTKAISCESKMLKLGTQILGFNVIDKQWPYDPTYFSKIKKSKITHFENLSEIVGDVLPSPIVKLLQETFHIGEVVVMKIMRAERILGEFTVFMEKGKQFQRDYLAELYANHVGLFLVKWEADVSLAKDKMFLETTLLSISDGVISTDYRGRILFINKVALELTGYQAEEAMGLQIEEVFRIKDEFSESYITDLFEQVFTMRSVVESLSHIVLVSKEGIIRPIEAIASPIMDQKQKFLGVVLVFSDFTEKKRQQDEIGYLSFHDQLTGLYNRRYYEEELARVDQERNYPISIILGDVNGLKLINDSLGHQMGDQLLVKVTEVIRRSSRADDIIARLGGDEFVLILPRTTNEVAETLIHRIRENAILENISGIPISISFGSATKTNGHQSFHDVFKDAEDMMYSRKLYEGADVRNKAVHLILSGLFEKNPRELNHSKRVSAISRKIAMEMGLEAEEVDRVALAGLMHDIGKIGVSEDILNKRESLNEDDWFKIRRHSEIGYRVLSSVNEFAMIADFILEHHENVDGSGYPKGLKGEELSLEAKIIAIADAFDAMTSMRNNGNGLSLNEAVKEIQNCAGKQFDLEVSRVFIEKVLKHRWEEDNEH